ncbi:rust resistance kinase Lr10-like [Senna tora]|uniref:Rust resistance kinase Lr10-like n=1 Tax=Senna tora TaxID=362788 RepID=A0A834U1P6_9FABA|nr:rust resistance kinase Lr10-like [Senna tora]
MGTGQKECKELRCGHHGPPIRFPFRLIDRQPHHCAYPIPSFHLTCTPNHQTHLHIPTPSALVQLSVKSIDYQSQKIQLFDPSPQPCLPSLFLKLHHHPSLSSIFPFVSDSPQFIHNITFLNCPSSLGPPYRYPASSSRTILGFLEDDINFGTQLEPPQDMLSCPIYAFDDHHDSEMILESDLLSCTKMFEISSNLTFAGELQRNYMDLVWLDPDCSRCEANGMRMKGEDEARVEIFLQDYRALKPTRFSYADVKRITNYFKHKLGEGAHGVVFKGKLSNEILVAVKILNNSEGDGKEFINEVGIMGKIHHVNVVRLLGFCADGFHRALVYDFFPKGSLQNFITPPENKYLFLGRKNTSTNSKDFQILYPEWVHNLVEGGGDTHINIEDEEDIKIARKLAIVGLWCIQWHPVNRPSMKNVVQMLEGDEDKLKVPPILFDSTTSGSTSAIVPPKRLNLELETIHELE